MSLKSPLGRVLGLGSAKEGTDHWWGQRVSAIALVPLGLWFAASIVFADDLSYNAVALWLARPINSILMILLSLAMLYHARLGLQVVIEDYVHGATKVLSLLAVKFLSIALAVAAVFAVVRVSLG